MYVFSVVIQEIRPVGHDGIDTRAQGLAPGIFFLVKEGRIIIPIIVDDEILGHIFGVGDQELLFSS